MHTSRQPAVVRRARLAVMVLFVANGLLLANVVPWLPIIKDELALSNTLFGVAVAGYPAGALVFGVLAGKLIGRWGSARTATVAAAFTAACVPLVGIAPNVVALCLAMLAAGSGDAVMDTAMNAHGVRVQRRYGRSIINTFHAAWSIGAVAGGVVGTTAIGLGIDRGLHLAVTAALVLVGVVACARWLLPGPEHAERTAEADIGVSTGTRTAMRAATWTILGLGAMLITATSVEDTAGTWGGVFLSDVVGAADGQVGLAFVVAQVLMVVGRMTGDRAVDRFGPHVVARLGLGLSAVGIAVVATGTSLWQVLLGFGLSGLGVSTVYPLAMTAAADIPGVRSGDGLTLVTWLSRIGFLAMPPVIGLVADATTLPTAMAVVVVLSTAGAFLASLLRPRDPTTS